MPKKNKKGGGGKGGGKTEEERLMFLQQRAQAEEELAMKKEEILTLFLKDKLQKEERNTAVNLLKLNEGWRSILRQTRAGELRHDLTVLSQTFERQLDALDHVVKNLERDLQEAQRQSDQVRRVHLRHLERLWAQQDARLKSVQQQWEDGLQHLSSRFSSERRQMSSQSRQQRADLEDATFVVEQQHTAVMTEIHRLYGESMAAYESAHQDRKAALVLDNKDQLREKMLQNREAEQRCDVEKRGLALLIAKTRHLVQHTDEHVKHVKMLQDALFDLRAQLNSSQTQNVSEERDVSDASAQVKRRTLELRGQLTQAHAAARKQLTQLTVQSDNAIKKLQAVVAKGQKVLRVAEACRKLESEQRTVPLSSFPPEELTQETTGPETQEPVKEIPELRQLERSVNMSVLRREALRKQRDDLSRENQQLRLLLRQRLDAMTVGGHDLDGRHALLTVHRAPTTAVPAETDRRHAVIEAVHAVKHSL